MQEQPPSFEELTKSMQDLAEKDLDENFEYTKNCKNTKTSGKTRNEELTQSGIQNENEIHLQQNSIFFKDKLKQNPGSATLDNAEIAKIQKLQEISESKSNTNNNTFAGFRTCF